MQAPLPNSKEDIGDLGMKSPFISEKVRDRPTVAMKIPLTLYDLERRDARGQFFRQISIIRLRSYSLTQNEQIGKVRRLFLGVSHAPSQGAGTLASLNFWDPLLTPVGFVLLDTIAYCTNESRSLSPAAKFLVRVCLKSLKYSADLQ